MEEGKNTLDDSSFSFHSTTSEGFQEESVDLDDLTVISGKELEEYKNIEEQRSEKLKKQKISNAIKFSNFVQRCLDCGLFDKEFSCEEDVNDRIGKIIELYGRFKFTCPEAVFIALTVNATENSDLITRTAKYRVLTELGDEIVKKWEDARDKLNFGTPEGAKKACKFLYKAKSGNLLSRFWKACKTFFVGVADFFANKLLHLDVKIKTFTYQELTEDFNNKEYDKFESNVAFFSNRYQELKELVSDKQFDVVKSETDTNIEDTKSEEEAGNLEKQELIADENEFDKNELREVDTFYSRDADVFSEPGTKLEKGKQTEAIGNAKYLNSKELKEDNWIVYGGEGFEDEYDCEDEEDELAGIEHSFGPHVNDDRRGHYKVNENGKVVNDNGEELKQDKNGNVYLKINERSVCLSDDGRGHCKVNEDGKVVNGNGEELNQDENGNVYLKIDERSVCLSEDSLLVFEDNEVVTFGGTDESEDITYIESIFGKSCKVNNEEIVNVETKDKNGKTMRENIKLSISEIEESKFNSTNSENGGTTNVKKVETEI